MPFPTSRHPSFSLLPGQNTDYQGDLTPIPENPQDDIPTVPISKTGAPFFRELREILTSNQNTSNKSALLIDALRHNDKLEPLITELERIQSENSTRLDAMALYGWEGLKEATEIDITMEKWDDFRIDIVDALLSLCQESCRVITESKDGGKFTFFGTPGPDSDIDIVFYPPSDMSEQNKIIIKTIFDYGALFLFKNSANSSRALDTDFFLRHFSEIGSTEMELQNENTKRLFSRIDLTASLFKVDGINISETGLPAIYRACLSERIAQIYPPIERATYENLFDSAFNEVADFQELLGRHRAQVKRRHSIISQSRSISKETASDTNTLEISDPADALAISFKKQCTLSISYMIDQIKGAIPKINDMTQIPSVLHNAFDRLPPELVHDKDLLNECFQLALAKLYLLRVSFFNGGYNSQGAYATICQNKYGQKHLREALSGQHPAIERSLSSEMLTLFPVVLKNPVRPLSTNLQYAYSSIENCIAFLSSYKTNPIEIDIGDLIKSSKYALRTLTCSDALLSKIDIGKISRDEISIYREYQTKIDTLIPIIIDLEKIKRQRSLPINFIAKRMAPIEKSGSFKKIFSTHSFNRPSEDYRFDPNHKPAGAQELLFRGALMLFNENTTSETKNDLLRLTQLFFDVIPHPEFTEGDITIFEEASEFCKNEYDEQLTELNLKLFNICFTVYLLAIKAETITSPISAEDDPQQKALMPILEDALLAQNEQPTTPLSEFTIPRDEIAARNKRGRSQSLYTGINHLQRHPLP